MWNIFFGVREQDDCFYFLVIGYHIIHCFYMEISTKLYGILSNNYYIYYDTT